MGEIEDQGFLLGRVGIVDDQRRLERLGRVHAQYQRIALVFQLHQAAGWVDAHDADEGLQRHLVEVLALLLEHQRQGLVRAQRLARVERVAQAVEMVGDGHQAAQPADRSFAQATRVAAAVTVLMVLVDDAQHLVIEHQLLPHAQAELCVHLQQLLLRTAQGLGLEQHLARHFQLADIVQQRAEAEAVAGLAVKAELTPEQQRQHGDVERVEVAVLGGLAGDAVQHHAGGAEQRLDHFADDGAGLAHGIFRAAAQGLVECLDALAGLDEAAVHVGQAAAQLAQLLRTLLALLCLRIDGQFDGGRRRHVFGQCQGRAVAARRIVAQLLQLQRTQGTNLRFILDLEIAEGEIMLPPAQVQMDVEADAKLIRRDVGQGGGHARLVG